MEEHWMKTMKDKTRFMSTEYDFLKVVKVLEALTR